MLKSPPLVATLSDSMRMSPCSWGDIFTWPLRGDRIIGLRQLVAEGLLKLRIHDTMIDHMVRQHHGASAFGDASAKHEVIRVVISQLLETADPINATFPYGHGRAEGESHALQHFGHKHARSHLHGHAQAFEPRPKSALYGYAAIDTGDQSRLVLAKRFHHGAQVFWLYSHIAVRNHQNVMPRCGLHRIHGKAPRVGPRWLSGSHDPHRHAGILLSQIAGDRQPLVRLVSRAEQNLVFRIIQLKESFQELPQARLRTVQRLQHAYGGRKSRRGLGPSPKTNCGGEYQGDVNRRCQDSSHPEKKKDS